MATSMLHLPSDTLVEIVLRHRLGLRFVLGQGGALHLPEWGARTLTWRGGEVVSPK